MRVVAHWALTAGSVTPPLSVSVGVTFSAVGVAIARYATVSQRTVGASSGGAVTSYVISAIMTSSSTDASSAILETPRIRIRMEQVLGQSVEIIIITIIVD